MARCHPSRPTPGTTLSRYCRELSTDRASFCASECQLSGPPAVGTHHHKRQTGECVDNDQFDFAVMMTRSRPKMFQAKVSRLKLPSR